MVIPTVGGKRNLPQRSLFPHKSENSFLFPVWAAELATSFLRLCEEGVRVCVCVVQSVTVTNNQQVGGFGFLICGLVGF